MITQKEQLHNFQITYSLTCSLAEKPSFRCSRWRTCRCAKRTCPYLESASSVHYTTTARRRKMSHVAFHGCPSFFLGSMKRTSSSNLNLRIENQSLRRHHPWSNESSSPNPSASWPTSTSTHATGTTPSAAHSSSTKRNSTTR